ncbi:MAG: amidohydrolase, partial [Gammaproteobacteria bacterium]
MPADAPPDLLLQGGQIMTMDPHLPQADALLARDGRIVAVGPRADVAPCARPGARVVDLAGRTALP